MLIYKTNFSKEKVFHLENDRGIFVLADGEIVSHLTATGKELKHIERNFRNLPFRLNREVQSWTGEVARFILENW